MNDLINKYNAKIQQVQEANYMFSLVLKALLISFLTYMSTDIIVLRVQQAELSVMIYGLLITLACWGFIFVIYILVKFIHDERAKYQLDTMLDKIKMEQRK